MKEMNRKVQFEETAKRLKVIIPVRVNWLLFGLFSALLAIWLVVLLLVGGFFLQAGGKGLVLPVLILIWLVIWLWSGRFLWNRWQYFAANREIMFIDQEQLILRRPVSILGLTTVYDFRHVSPFYQSDRHDCPAFDYAYFHVYFGQSLPRKEAQSLVDNLNARFFPDEVDE